MISQPFILFVRRQFPGPWHSLLGLLIFLVLLTAGSLTGTHLAHRSGSLEISAFVYGLAALFWWLQIVPHSCNLACDMAALRLPRISRLLAETLTTHLLLTVALPVLVLGLLHPATDLFRLGGLLALGSTLAFLVLGLPGIAALPLLIGSIYPLGQTQWLNSTQANWFISGLLLILAILIWRWRWYRPAMNTGWLASWSQMLDIANIMQRLKHHEQSRWKGASFANFCERLTLCTHQSTPLAEVLGPKLKTLTQLYGWRGQFLTCLLFAAASILLIELEPDSALRNLLVFFLPITLFVIAQAPANLLTGSGSQALQAELLLLPGLPAGPRLLPLICRQIILGLANKLGLQGLVFLPVVLIHDFPTAWILWFVLWILLMLPTSLLMTLLAWAGRSKYWQVGLMLALPGLGLPTSFVLYYLDPVRVDWILTGWCLIGISLLFTTWRCYQQVQQRGVPFSS